MFFNLKKKLYKEMQTMVVSEVKQTKICKHIQEMQVYYWWVYVY